MAERAENPLIAQAAQWLSRRQDGPLAPDMQREFEAWLDASPHHAVAFARVEASWERARRLEAAPPAVEAARRSHRWSRPWPFAAAALLVLAAGIASWLLLRPGIYHTDVGERRTVLLADGSQVELNTASRLRVDYSGQHREVRLMAGEALFQVARDASRPFVVHAGGASVRALGTEFNVRMRARDVVEVTVTEGVVAVEGAAVDEQVDEDAVAPPARTFTAGEAAMVGYGAVAPLVLDLDALGQRTAWRRDVIELRGETLDQAVAEFNRYRAIPLVVGDARIASIRVGGTFATNESDKFLEALQSGFGIRAVDGAQGRVYLVSAQ